MSDLSDLTIEQLEEIAHSKSSLRTGARAELRRRERSYVFWHGTLVSWFALAVAMAALAVAILKWLL